ncbi:hypothetical protein BK659_21495 [Pseudomonas brassicacearum]|uniref:Toxin n=1 Tax=Pseudomonas brassicacearum TaxID=930166 RepID=A0A423H1R2_9PSED|nr:RHS repeat-associated core domain-containing protein [Pseudomonas brassicacearum]RON05680.1 hypothetical protein BK659_21495 [Pseudomonas brassicacearum]
MSLHLHKFTPTLAAIDPRGLAVAAVSYHRINAIDEPTARINRQSFDAAGRTIVQWDARLWADGGESGVPNQAAIYNLSGQALRTESVDAGWRVGLLGDAGQALEGWDGRGTHRQTHYDSQLRPVNVHEQMANNAQRCVERFTYGSPTGIANGCGRPIRHDDPAGSRVFADYGLLGQVLTQTQRFLTDLDTPNWPESVAERNALLETDGQGVPVSYTTHWFHDGSGAVLSQIDAAGTAQLMRYNVAGQLTQSSLTPESESEQILLSEIIYNALGQVTSETAGNGVTTQGTYSAADGRLQRLYAACSNKVLQDLNYTQDPVGNVLSIEDLAQPTQWFNAKQINPLSTYRYDTLYQLIEATGRESVQAGIHPGLPGLVLPGGGDASRLRNYTQTFAYDAGGNLLTLKHGQSPRRTMKVAEGSNRSLYMADVADPPDLNKSFDANGNMRVLEGAQTMDWDARNQLQRVMQVVRDDGPDDTEVYVYDSAGQRRRKVRIQQAKTLGHVAQVRYLPGLEIRHNTATGEVLYVTTAQAGRSGVRRLHWLANGRKALPTPQLRYSVGDHLGSCALELDEHGEVISHEGYYPYGGTAWWAAGSQTHAHYKTIRYSGKERDATGLYYYGFRYYAPWLNRWVSPDPAGNVDGLNLFQMVRNNPLTFRDGDGRAIDDDDDFSENSPSANAGGYPLDPQLGRRLDEYEKNIPGQQAAVARELTHTRHGEYMVESTYTDPKIPGRYRFKNVFRPGLWTLKENFRAPGSESNATSVTWKGYEMVSRANGFYGVYPKIIVQWDVVNNDALRATDGLESGSEEMLVSFLSSKGNGRSTQRILDVAGMRATRVERKEVRDHQKGVDIDIIVVHVEPNPTPQMAGVQVPQAGGVAAPLMSQGASSPPDADLRMQVERDLRRLARPPLSRAAHSAWRSVKHLVQSRKAS